MKIKVVFLALILGFISINKCFAYDQINKNLNLVKGYVYLLDFNDKILRYTLGNNESAKIELVSSIFKNQQEVIVKALKESDTNLLLWTKDNVYNFNINITAGKPLKKVDVISDIKNNSSTIAGSLIMQSFSKDNENLSADVKNQLEDLSLDEPPHLQSNQDLFGFEIDQPPRR